MRRILRPGVLAACGSLACGPHSAEPSPAKPKTPPPPLPGNEMKADLPAIAAKIELTTSSPTDGNAPDKRSPVLDVLKSENMREIETLKKQSDPAYYLAYQLEEQRIVSLEAEGGALTVDNEDTQRNLDV